MAVHRVNLCPSLESSFCGYFRGRYHYRIALIVSWIVVGLVLIEGSLKIIS